MPKLVNVNKIRGPHFRTEYTWETWRQAKPEAVIENGIARSHMDTPVELDNLLVEVCRGDDGALDSLFC